MIHIVLLTSRIETKSKILICLSKVLLYEIEYNKICYIGNDLDN